MAYFNNISIIGRLIYPSLVWNMPRDSNTIYLSFDDGPHPEITPWVLEQLIAYNAKATFFCVGENIKKYPEIFQQILSEGHSQGNHTYNHLKGWKTPTGKYVENVQKAQTVIEKFAISQRNSKLFRPPYGKIKSSQIKRLQLLNYKIVMWDALSGDFDENISADSCFQNISKNINAGSIIVFHDSEKAFKNLEKVLPRVLEFYSAKGFSFKGI